MQLVEVTDCTLLSHKLNTESLERSLTYILSWSLADIGFLGFPSPGKSTLLACLIRAFPKFELYPFTTLSPTVGKIRCLDDFEMTLGDTPGLIEGSHENKGLGHNFLRYIERTSVFRD